MYCSAHNEHSINITEEWCQCGQVNVKTKEKFKVLNMPPKLTPTYLFSNMHH